MTLLRVMLLVACLSLAAAPMGHAQAPVTAALPVVARSARPDASASTHTAISASVVRRPAGQSIIYTVRPGDTLTRIAAQFGVTIPALLAANPSIVNPNQIRAGQQLVIPRAGQAVPQVSLSPTFGPPGTPIRVTASGFPRDAVASLALGRQGGSLDVVRQVRVSANGTLDAQATIPAFALPDERWIALLSTVSGPRVEARSNPFVVTTQTGQPPAVVLSPTSGPPGIVIRVLASGFPANTAVDVELGREGLPLSLIARTRTSGAGGLDLQAALPTTARPNERWLVRVRTTEGAAIEATSPAFLVTTETGQAARVILSPTSGPAGTIVDITVAGFPANTLTDLGIGRVDGVFQFPARIRTDVQGGYPARVVIPAFAAANERWAVRVRTAEGAFVEATSNSFLVSAVQFTPRVLITPTSGVPGTEINVLATGFPANTPLTLGVGREGAGFTFTARVQTDAAGNFSGRLIIPTFAGVNEHWLVLATTAEGPRVEANSNTFFVTQPPAEPAGVTISPTGGPPGTLVSVAVTGFPANTPVEIGVGLQGQPTSAALYATTNANGKLNAQVTIPTFAAPDTFWTVTVRTTAGIVTAAVSGPFRVTSSAPPPTPTVDRVQVYLVALGAGSIGCGDELVGVTRSIAPTQSPVTSAIRELLSIKDRIYGQSGLYNALYQSNLRIEDINLTSGRLTVRLVGDFLIGGVCDSPRVEAQIRRTAMQFGNVSQVDIYINGQPIGVVAPAPAAR